MGQDAGAGHRTPLHTATVSEKQKDEPEIGTACRYRALVRFDTCQRHMHPCLTLFCQRHAPTAPSMTPQHGRRPSNCRGRPYGDLRLHSTAQCCPLPVSSLLSWVCSFGGFGSDLCSGNYEESWRDRSEFVRLAGERARQLSAGEHPTS